MRKWIARVALGILGSPLVLAFVYGNVTAYHMGGFSLDWQGVPTGTPWYDKLAIIVALFFDIPIALIGAGVVIFLLYQAISRLWRVAYPEPLKNPNMYATSDPDGSGVMREMTEGELVHQVLGDDYLG